MRMNRLDACRLTMLYLLILLISGCDFFWGMPWGKNPRDPTSQIGVVRAVNVGDNSVALAWDWRPFLSGDPIIGGTTIDPNRKIEELQIMHGVGSPPAFVPPLPLGEAFTDRTDPSGWYKTFEDLQDDREHYFSIYGREESGEWVGPWTVSRNVERRDVPQPGNIYFDTSHQQWTIAGGVSNNSGNPVVVNETTSAVIEFSGAVSGDIGFVAQGYAATLSMGVTTGNSGTVGFYPLRWQWNDSLNLTLLVGSGFTIDKLGGVQKSFSDTDSDGLVDIVLEAGETKLLTSRMALFGNSLIFIEASDGGDILSIDPVNIDFSYWWY